MLEDRDYMRATSDGNDWFGRLPISLWLVILNAVFFAAQQIFPLTQYLALHPTDLLRGYVWQLVTFQVLHAGLWHLVINCAMLYVFGRPVEHALGRANLLKLYFGSGVVGGLLQAAVGLLFPRLFGMGPVVGASAGVFGLIAAFAMLHREEPVTMLLAFIIPVSMKAKYLLVVEVILALLGMLDTASGIAHAAHLGGMLAGVVYIRNVIHWRWRVPWPRRTGLQNRSRQLVGARARKSPGRERPPAGWQEDLPTDEFLAKEVDPILDKISAHGIQSLTERERRVLEAARRKMQRR